MSPRVVGCVARIIPLVAHPDASDKITKGETMSEAKHREPDELVEVFDTQEESEAWVVQGLLESAGIDAVITGFDAPQNVLPGVGGVAVRVAPEQAEEARRVISENRGAEPPDEGTTDDTAA